MPPREIFRYSLLLPVLSAFCFLALRREHIPSKKEEKPKDISKSVEGVIQKILTLCNGSSRSWMALLIASCGTYEDSPLPWISSTAICRGTEKTNRNFRTQCSRITPSRPYLSFLHFPLPSSNLTPFHHHSLWFPHLQCTHAKGVDVHCCCHISDF